MATSNSASIYTTLTDVTSHALKSCSVTIGAYSLAGHCERLELLARKGPVPDPASSVEVIGKEYRRAEAALIGRLARLELAQPDRAPQMTAPSLGPAHIEKFR